MEPTRPLRPSDVAELLGVDISTVRNWADRGLLPCLRTPTGQRRFRPEDVQKFLVPRTAA